MVTITVVIGVFMEGRGGGGVCMSCVVATLSVVGITVVIAVFMEGRGGVVPHHDNLCQS